MQEEMRGDGGGDYDDEDEEVGDAAMAFFLAAMLQQLSNTMATTLSIEKEALQELCAATLGQEEIGEEEFDELLKGVLEIEPESIFETSLPSSSSSSEHGDGGGGAMVRLLPLCKAFERAQVKYGGEVLEDEDNDDGEVEGEVEGGEVMVVAFGFEATENWQIRYRACRW
jgi:hypothetical protein